MTKADGLQRELAACRRELALIDEALARRPALADKPTRYEKVAYACQMAGAANEAALAAWSECWKIVEHSLGKEDALLRIAARLLEVKEGNAY